jgi:hypothetical protein
MSKQIRGYATLFSDISPDVALSLSVAFVGLCGVVITAIIRFTSGNGRSKPVSEAVFKSEMGALKELLIVKIGHTSGQVQSLEKRVVKLENQKHRNNSKGSND